MDYKILPRCSKEAATGPVLSQTRQGDVLKCNTYKIRVYIILALASEVK